MRADTAPSFDTLVDFSGRTEVVTMFFWAAGQNQ